MNHSSYGHAVTTTALALIVCGVGLAAGPADLQKGAGGIPYHYVGRVKLNFVDSTGVVYGYMTAVSGVSDAATLFAGVPSEATAHLTFRADIKFQALPGNGPLNPGQFAVTPILVEAGTWSIYFTPNPAHNWDDPDTFSDGQLVATLDRQLEQFSVYPAFSINAGAATLKSSTPFRLAEQRIDLRELISCGIVNVTSGPPIPLNGSSPSEPIFAFSGYSLATGRR
jgi:hypothetical protein